MSSSNNVAINCDSVRTYSVMSRMSGEWTINGDDCRVMIKQGMASKVTISDNQCPLVEAVKAVGVPFSLFPVHRVNHYFVLIGCFSGRDHLESLAARRLFYTGTFHHQG